MSQDQLQTFNGNVCGEHGLALHCTSELQCTRSFIPIYYKYSYQVPCVGINPNCIVRCGWNLWIIFIPHRKRWYATILLAWKCCCRVVGNVHASCRKSMFDQGSKLHPKQYTICNGWTSKIGVHMFTYISEWLLQYVNHTATQSNCWQATLQSCVPMLMLVLWTPHSIFAEVDRICIPNLSSSYVNYKLHDTNS